MIPAIESQIQNLLNEIEEAQARGEHEVVKELTEELDELCECAKENCGI